MKLAIYGLTADERNHVREAVAAAVRYWPNAHLGDVAPRDDLHCAFRQIRRDAMAHRDMHVACAAMLRDTDRYVDM